MEIADTENMNCREHLKGQARFLQKRVKQLATG